MPDHGFLKCLGIIIFVGVISSNSVSTNSTSGGNLRFEFNANTSTEYNYFNSVQATFTGTQSGTSVTFATAVATTTGQSIILKLDDYANTTGWKTYDIKAMKNGTNYQFTSGFLANTAAINRITLKTNTGTFDSGTYVLYGVK